MATELQTTAIETRVEPRTEAAAKLLMLIPSSSQLGLLVGLAAALAIGVGLMLSAMKAPMMSLGTGMDASRMQEIIQTLNARGIDHEYNVRIGEIRVPSNELDNLTMELKSRKLLGDSTMNLGDILSGPPDLGRTTFSESKRYYHALERELAKSIAETRGVRGARVHLAIPKSNIFNRDRHRPSASVVVELDSGRVLEAAQVLGIRHLVANGVPYLESARVDVIDQFGTLLTDHVTDERLSQANQHLDLQRRRETEYENNIRELLAGLVGPDSIRVQVHANMDFSRNTRTKKEYVGDPSKVRSEQLNVRSSKDSAEALGIPGALTNQPPGEGTTDPASAAGDEAGGEQGTRSKSQLKNYELDEVIQHVELPTGQVRRLTVALAIDHMKTTEEDGSVKTEPRSDEDLDRITRLVKSAVGFDEARGDQVEVVTQLFVDPMVIDPPEPLPLWEQSWFWNITRQALAGLVLIAVLFGIVRPGVKSFIREQIGRDKEAAALAHEADGAEGEAREDGEEESADGEASELELLAPPPKVYGDILNLARELAENDPKRIATVLKEWVAADAA